MLRSAMTVPSAYDGQYHSVITLVNRRLFQRVTLRSGHRTTHYVSHTVQRVTRDRQGYDRISHDADIACFPGRTPCPLRREEGSHHGRNVITGLFDTAADVDPA